jgi:hypothetical protein
MTVSDFAGTYASAEMSVELRVDDGRLAGEILLRGQRMPLRASPKEDHIEGTFTANGSEFPFHARLEGPHLRLVSGGVEHVLPAAPAVNPLAALVPPPAAAASSPAEPQVFRHPTGGQFTVPAGWSALPAAGGVQLIPPASGFDAAGPTEVYAVTTEPAPGVAAADDARVLAYVDQSLAQMIPNVERAGPPEPLGCGVRLRHHARNPLTGAGVDVVSLLALLRGSAVAVIGIADPAILAGRTAALEAVFSSLAWVEGDTDAALVGVWRGAGIAMTDEQQSIELGADGTAVAGHGASRRLGTWNAGAGMLYLLWADGSSSTWRYQISGGPGERRAKLLRPGGATPIEWVEGHGE